MAPKKKKLRILYAGDSEVGGPANYLLAVLKFIRARVTHVPPSKTLHPKILSRRYDVIILSDFSKRKMPAASERALAEQVRMGAGLLMVGGWGSFSGPFGGWHGSIIEKILPVDCRAHDDRLNFPGGALIQLKQKHAMFRGLSFKNPPVICGLNRIRPKKGARIILSARRIVTKPHVGAIHELPLLTLGSVEYPLLVLDQNPKKRIAALATDLAPHWCGGLVDWGSRRMKLPVTGKIQVEVGDRYVDFVTSIVKGLAELEPVPVPYQFQNRYRF